MILAFIKEIEEIISSSSIVISSNIQKYFSSTKKEAYIKGKLTFVDLSSLEFAIFVLEKGKKILFDKYRFQYVDDRSNLVFRYDNAPHYKHISSFPFHKHLRDDKIVASTVPKFNDIIEEITAVIVQADSSL